MADKENQGIDMPFVKTKQNDSEATFDLDKEKQLAKDRRKDTRLRSAIILLIILLSIIVFLTIGQSLIEVFTSKEIEILDSVNVFLQYAVTTVLGYLFATKSDE